MVKKLMSLGLVGILSVSLMAGCDSSDNDKDDDTITIKHVDENGNTIKKEKVTKEEAKRIEENQKQQATKDNTKDNSSIKKETKKQPKEDSTTEDDRNLDDILYGNAARGTCPDCGRTAMVFNHGAGLKCAYCGFYDDGYFLPEEPDPSYSDNKDDDYDDYDETQDYDYDEHEESPSEPVEEDMN